MHCHRFNHPGLSRRELLRKGSQGFGALALTALLRDPAFAGSPLAALPEPHHRPRARNVIFLYMDGGPSQVDTFDYKPLLERFHGEDPRQAIGRLERTQFDSIGKVMKSHWEFKQHGEAGHWISSLFPHLAGVADELTFIKSMVSEFPEHTAANYFLHTGSGLQGRPSMGAWVGYGLGSVSQDLPGFVVLNGGLIPPGGLDNFNSGFLPATYQASIFRPADVPVANIRAREDAEHQRAKLDLLGKLDGLQVEHHHQAARLESAIANYETAFRMQAAVPELADLSGETEATRKLYGLDAEWSGTRTFAQQCLLARRLVERGVRFIELTCPDGNGDRWDQHARLKEGHERNCVTVDQPIAGLIRDLRVRGLLDETLVIWGGEFGRTPFAQGSDGRDHNPTGFTIWLAGGGVRPGLSYGATDDWGYRAIDNRVDIHDLHATMLHLLGLDHERSTVRFGGRDMRLTDVHGHVLREIVT